MWSCEQRTLWVGLDWTGLVVMELEASKFLGGPEAREPDFFRLVNCFGGLFVSLQGCGTSGAIGLIWVTNDLPSFHHFLLDPVRLFCLKMKSIDGLSLFVMKKGRSCIVSCWLSLFVFGVFPRSLYCSAAIARNGQVAREQLQRRMGEYSR